MTRALRFRPALLRSAALFAASAVFGPVFGQALPPGAVPVGMPAGAISAPAGTEMIAGDPFAGGAYAVPTAGPVAVAYGDPATLSGGTIGSAPTDGTILSAPGPLGNQVFMAPQVIGSPQMIGSPMPGSPGCNCGPGGAMMMDPSMAGMSMGAQSYGTPMMGGAPMMGSPYGACGPAYDDGCCLDDCCLGCLGGLCGGAAVPACDPCQQGVPICDPCQATPPVCQPGGGVYHSMGGKPRCGWSTGFTWVFLKPYYGANEAFATTSGGVTTVRDFDHSLDTSPRVFVEWVSRSDWGLRVTWFGYENESDAQTVLVPAGGTGLTALGQVVEPGQTISAISEFDVDTIDFDATQRLRVSRSLVNVGGGVRWMGYEHEYRSAIAGPLTARTGEASRQFSGVGPTVFAEWRRPIAASRFSLLAQVRGSLLYGESETDVLLASNGSPDLIVHTENDDFVAMGETQLGGEWSAWVGQRTVLFVQLAYEAQALLGVGTALDANDDLGLHGFNTKVGLEW